MSKRDPLDKAFFVQRHTLVQSLTASAAFAQIKAIRALHRMALIGTAGVWFRPSIKRAIYASVPKRTFPGEDFEEGLTATEPREAPAVAHV